MSGRLSRFVVVGAALGVGLAVAGTGALAHNTHGETATTPGARAALARHDNFEKVGATFKRLNDELRKGDPDKAVLTQSAGQLKTYASQLPTWFPRGSGQEARPKSEAKANIWSDAAGFTAAASNLQVQTSKLQQLAQAGDVDALKAQVRATGGACKGCHDKYRVPKES
ncbi:cytochrome c [Phenylobacterium sp. J367]|uniref:c-type cytochrome n=1 Tax=Phenylobacterium sp. J367 TaxID=2898435 RepID=UPI002151792E|nr:cytochrome c [Phenylobacterium sp. J367]MCR5880891.1 cytochrome c [Phenylobacterium sp. J367]